MIEFRKALTADLDAVSEIFDSIHTEEEEGRAVIGWVRDVYPTAETARLALTRGDLFVETDAGEVVGTAIINQLQVDAYASGKWRYEVPDSEVMVLHTLVISPQAAHKGYGRAFVSFYETYARSHDCHYLRIDTNARNAAARKLYHSLDYEEIGIVPTVFNGISGVQLVLLEKKV